MQSMIINTEWGAFGAGKDGLYLMNEFDREIDAHSTHPGQNVFDKCVAGMY
jgi:hexokinase